MDIPGLSMTLSQMDLSSKVGVAMLRKSMDNAEASGNALVEMMDRSMELSVNPNIGSNIDLLV